MRFSLVRLRSVLFGSVIFTMCLIGFVNFVTSNGTKEDQRTVDKLHNLNTIERRILGGRVLQVSPWRGLEYIFSNKSTIDRNVTTERLETKKESVLVVQPKADLKANNVNEERSKADNKKIHQHGTKHDGKKSVKQDVPKTCKPKRAADRMENLFGEQFNRTFSPFMTLSSLQSASLTRYPLPFGFHGTQGAVRSLLEMLPDTDIPADIRNLPCRRCIVIGNGGLMKGAQLGEQIDKYDAVFRLNSAPIKGYETDVGTKTTIRVVYPESSVISPEVYAQKWTLLVVAFKSADIEWVRHIIEGRDLRKLKGFWHPTADFVPKPKKDIRLFNPEITSELSTNLIGLKMAKGKMDKNVPTTGALVIMVALRFCDEISVAGFGYDIKRPDTPIHYYSSEKTKSILASFTHNIDDEKKFLQKLVKQGVINDLTGGLRNHF